jgi:hypothetical protein
MHIVLETQTSSLNSCSVVRVLHCSYGTLGDLGISLCS